MKAMETVCVHLAVMNSGTAFPQRQAPVSRNDSDISRCSEHQDLLGSAQPSLQIRRSITAASAGTLL